MQKQKEAETDFGGPAKPKKAPEKVKAPDIADTIKNADAALKEKDELDEIFSRCGC